MPKSRQKSLSVQEQWLYTYDHVKERALERYGYSLSTEQYLALNKEIREGRAILLGIFDQLSIYEVTLDLNEKPELRKPVEIFYPRARRNSRRTRNSEIGQLAMDNLLEEPISVPLPGEETTKLTRFICVWEPTYYSNEGSGMVSTLLPPDTRLRKQWVTEAVDADFQETQEEEIKVEEIVIPKLGRRKKKAHRKKTNHELRLEAQELTRTLEKLGLYIPPIEVQPKKVTRFSLQKKNRCGDTRNAGRIKRKEDREALTRLVSHLQKLMPENLSEC